jgi:hypothetical protein
VNRLFPRLFPRGEALPSLKPLADKVVPGLHCLNNLPPCYTADLLLPCPCPLRRHTARFLFFWLTLLPFALYSSVGPWTVPVVVGISAVLCGIEEIGVQCEEPFGWVGGRGCSSVNTRVCTDWLGSLRLQCPRWLSH